MKKKSMCLQKRHWLGRRIFSFMLIFAMAVTMVQTQPMSPLTVKAAEGVTNIRVHFYNEYGWTAPALQYWGGSDIVPGEYESGPTEIDGWGGAQGYVLKDEGDGWYSMSLKGNMDGFQFLDMKNPSNNTGGKGYSSYMTQYNSEAPVDLYCKYNEATGYNCKWYTDKECTVELAAPADAITKCNLTLHCYHADEAVNLYVWDAAGNKLLGDWPGTAMTPEDTHTGWYTTTLDVSDAAGISFIFNWGTGQTGDLSAAFTAETMELWCEDTTTGVLLDTAPESWTNPDGGGSDTGDGGGTGDGGDTAISELKVSDRVQLKIGENLADMQLYRNGVYETAVSLPAGTHEARVLVNGAEYGNADTVTVPTDSSVYFRLNRDGKLQDSVNEKIVHTAALTGNFNGIEFINEAGDRYDIASWAPADGNGELAYVGGGIYTRTFYMKALAADVDIADGGYKIAFDDGWDYAMGNGSDNIPVTIPAGSTEWTIFVDEINGNVYDSVRTGTFETVHNSGNVKRVPFKTTISFIGDARGTGGDADWDASAKGYEFTAISDTMYCYQKTFAPGTYNYKCVFDYTDWYEAEDGNRSIRVTEDGTTVVFLYDTADGKLYDSVNHAEVLAVKLGMKTAPAKMEVTDNVNGSATFTALADAGKKVTLYYGAKSEVETRGAAALTAETMTEEKSGTYRSKAMYLGDEALDIVYYYDIEGNRTLDGSNPTVTIAGMDYSNYTRAQFTGRLVCVPGTFPGPSWDAAGNIMTYRGNGLYEYKFEGVPAANYEYKIAMGAWSENYGKDGVSDGGNIAVTVPKKQDVSVFYNDFSHRSVTSLDYVFADISLTGTGIPEGTKLTDDGLTGIYSAVVPMTAGIYSDVKLGYGGREFLFAEFEVDRDKDVTFYFDPVSEIYYNNASNRPVDTAEVFFDTKDAAYKSVFGAVAAGENVRFTMQTGTDVTQISMIVKGVETRKLSMKKDGAPADGKQKWSVTTSFDTIGEYSYYFVLSNGSSVSVYADDDGYYGTGKTSELTDIMPYELVVYEAGFETPDWMKNAVIYQIFPDRFYDGDNSNDFAQTTARGEVDYEYVKDWYMLPENPEQEVKLSQEEYEAAGAFYGDGNWSNEIYGGDFAGIVERIDYLKALGVNVIYLNPVFASISSHRYDTSDYSVTDPVLGNMGDFEELVEVAEANDMHIILDGVFNHVSDDSIYFDRYYKYLEAGTDAIGAYPYWAYVYDYMSENGVEKEAAETAAKAYFTENYGIRDYSYTGWFDVYQKAMTDDKGNVVTDSIGMRAGKPVYGYEGWWGYDSMPVIMSTDGSEFQTGNWAEKIIYNEEGTSITQYWLSKGSNGWRLDVANEVSDETWQNFRDSVKALNSDAVIVGEIWDDATEYLKGDMYDSVMNYVFRGAVLDFAKGGSAYDSMNTLEKIRERYPKEAFYAMMNLVDSHDTTRVLSYLDGIDDDRKQTDIASAFPTYENTSELAKKRQYLTAFLQFTYPGAPTVYYGDEIGMVGADDPDDRRGFCWGEGNRELVTWYAKLAAIRAAYPALRTGDLTVIDAGENVMGYLRADADSQLIVLANNAQEEKTVTVNLKDLGMKDTEFADLISGSSYTAENDAVTVKVLGLSGIILTADAKAVSVNETALAPAYDSAYKVANRVLAADVTLNQTTAALKTGESVTLSAAVAPAEASCQTVIWTSDNEAVATVDASGKVTAVAAGTAKITARAAFTADETVSASCTLTVAKAEAEEGGDNNNNNNNNNNGNNNNSNNGNGSSDNSQSNSSNNGNSSKSGTPQTSDEMASRIYASMMLLLVGASLIYGGRKKKIYR